MCHSKNLLEGKNKITRIQTMNNISRLFPSEWEKHQATLLSFPAEGRDWPFISDRKTDAYCNFMVSFID